ncbi:MAG: glycoside hydrolase family 88 protein [Flavobacteriaceae bacterium]|nr:glycoside hydrolase family 88 protein [Flavobacteriaceae bacterium]
MKQIHYLILLLSFNGLVTKSPLYAQSTTDFEKVDCLKEEVICLDKIQKVFDWSKQHASKLYLEVERTKKFPRSIGKGLREIRDWTSGFLPGIFWLLYEYNGDDELRQKAAFLTALLEEEKNNIVDHDIGFRIYSSYGRGFHLLNDPDYKQVIIDAANSAIVRYNPKVKAIKSWEPNLKRDWKFPVIIDNLMNLELLFAATEMTGDSIYYDIAVQHAYTTKKHHYRSDFSTSHVIDFDPETGSFRKRDWNNGHGDVDTTTWSRGQSWGLYGYTMAYRFTENKDFLKQAEDIGQFLLNHPNMPEDYIPYWDYSYDGSSDTRDASAAAILASGLLELSQYSKEYGEWFFQYAVKILNSLQTTSYMAEPHTNHNFLLKRATGNFTRNSEVDGPLIYADYYFLEAMMRYAKMTNQFDSITLNQID